MSPKKTTASPVDALRAWSQPRGGALGPVVEALLSSDAAVDAWLASDEAAAFGRRLLHLAYADLQNALDDEEGVSAQRWLAIARLDPKRFLWVAEPEQVLGDEGAGFRELLLPFMEDLELQSALKWLRSEDFLDSAEASRRLERRLEEAEEGAGWYALAAALDALRARGFGWKAARHLTKLFDRVWADAREAAAVEAVAVEFMTVGLWATMARHAPWRGSSDRLGTLARRVSTSGLTQLLGQDPPLLASMQPREAEAAVLVAWREVSGRKEEAALDASAATLARLRDQPLARAGGLDAVLALQRVHGEDATPALVHAFLAGLHRTAHGEVIERWLLQRPRPSLEAALDDLPEWLERFEPRAMDRLAWRLVPKLQGRDLDAVTEVAEAIGGQRGEAILAELS